MNKSNQNLLNKDVVEAQRFDDGVKKLYKDDSELFIEPINWEKFETTLSIPHPYAYVVQSLGDLRGKRILEFGCGTGIFSIILINRGAEFIEAFDISPESIELAKKRAEVNKVADKVNYSVKSVYDMNYKVNSFDFIVGLNILHHIDISRIASQIKALLKPGGIAYFNEPFGNVKWLEKLRLFVPVSVNEEDKSHWNEQLKYSDIEKFNNIFRNINFKEFHIFSRLDRVVKSKSVLEALAKIDEWLLKKIPFLRKYARRIVLVLKN